MLHIHFSNRLESLRALLLRQLGDDAAGVFEELPVIVPHAAMRRMLSLAIADAHGICANVRFDFLAQWLWRQIAKVVPEVADESPFAASRLTWRVYEAFGDAGFVSGHARLAAYLDGADALLRHELAGRVAAVLEQYVTYRSDWLRAWHDGHALGLGADTQQDEAWQAALWRRIDTGPDRRAQHPAEAFAAALQRGGSALARAAGLPRRVHVFALPGLPPLHLQLLRQLAPWVESHLYVLNPCQEYWFDLVDRRRLSHLAVAGRSAAHEEGNRLLTAWGQATQVQLEALVALDGDNVVDDSHFEAARDGTLLHRVQNAVLELQPIEPASIAWHAGDRSVELHVCHSLTRELEVLHDRLLGLFAADAGLQPADILVVTPDLDRAAPLIDAIFGTAPPQLAIPYLIAGRSRSGQNAAARALLDLLALVESRCSASALFALLQQPLVARRFDLDDAALTQLHDWLRAAGFHWALDARHLGSFDVPTSPRHTLDDALQRLFLGHALPAAADAPFAGVLGVGDAEGSRALVLGAFWRFADALRRLQAALQRPMSSQAWAAALFGMLDEFMLGGEDDLDEWHELQATLRQLFDDMHGGDLTQPLPLSVLRAALQQQLDDPARRAGGGGSVTFASMSSHRGLPYAVICAIGLNDGAFPAPAPPLEFDLMAQSPRRGDRQRRLDERALMLDLLLAARDCLHLSHTGRSVRDNAALPPSVLVAELLDLLVPAMADDAGSAAALRRARAQLVVEHGLQPFARQAFVDGGDQRLRSYNAELAEALRHSLAQRGALPAEAGSDEGDADDDGGFDDGTTTASWAPQPLFFPAALPPPQPAWRQVSLAQLIEFFRNPARYVLRRRLGIELPRAGDELQDDEALVPDAAARSLLARRLLPPLLRGADDHTLQALAGAGTELPAGRLGQRQLQRELLALRQFAQRVRDASVEPCLAPHSTSLEFAFGDETWVLGSAQAELRPSGLLRWRYGDSRAGDYLEAWLQHLVLCADSATPAARHTRWLSADGEFAFDACDDALAQLAALLGLYRRGLSEALHFYPRTAWQWVRHGRGKALAAWRSTRDRPFGEDADPAYGLALRGVDNALDGAFEALAQQVFGPLLSHLRDARVAP